MKRAILVFAVSLAFTLACAPVAPAVPPSPGPATCAAACANGRQLCGFYELAPKGPGTCEDVCDNATANAMTFHTGCLAGATTCEGFRACGKEPVSRAGEGPPRGF